MSAHVHIGNVLDVLPTIPAGSVHCCVTSPPYWRLRDYGVDGQLGLEPTPDEYVARMVAVFREVRRVLRDDGTLWLNLGDSYCASPPGSKPSWSTSGLHGAATSERYQDTLAASVQTVRDKTFPGLKPKDLVGIPWRVAFALQSDGWYLRSDIIWSKPNPMPESVTDRPTKAHEYLFLMTKQARYWYDADAVAEASVGRELFGNWTGGKVSSNGDRNDGDRQDMTPTQCRNRRTVWHIATQPYADAQFATYPEKLVEPCVLAGCPVGGTVLDPFTGSGTTGAVACRLGRNFVGIELNPEYAAMAERRIAPHRDQMQLVTP